LVSVEVALAEGDGGAYHGAASEGRIGGARDGLNGKVDYHRIVGSKRQINISRSVSKIAEEEYIIACAWTRRKSTIAIGTRPRTMYYVTSYMNNR